jgi:hypothetical protein
LHEGGGKFPPGRFPVSKHGPSSVRSRRLPPQRCVGAIETGSRIRHARIDRRSPAFDKGIFGTADTIGAIKMDLSAPNKNKRSELSA